MLKNLEMMIKLTDKISSTNLIYQGEEKTFSGNQFALKFDQTELVLSTNSE